MRSCKGEKENNKVKISKKELTNIIKEEIEKARKEKVNEISPFQDQGPQREEPLGSKAGDETDRSDDNRFLNDKKLKVIAQSVDDLGNLDMRIIKPAMRSTNDPKMKRLLANIQSVVRKVENDIYYLFGPDTLRGFSKYKGN